ncbi:MAG TPA: hypothetical protein VMW10_06510 [Alphaproteobacteria bacterium]|nr:hypothetical protein [Alphaproteobacteria bacterium]
MIIKVASRVLKQPMEIFIPDAEWKELEAQKDQEKVNATLSKKALGQVAKYGYSIGYCSKNKKEVTLMDCLKCGATQRGWKVGLEGRYDKAQAKLASENINNWEVCKRQNIHYKFMPNKPLLSKVDDKLLQKMKPESMQERKQDASSFVSVEKTVPKADGEFENNSSEFLKNVKDK